PAQGAAAPPALARHAFWIPFVPAKAGTQNHGLRPLDSRLRGNERDYAFASNTPPRSRGAFFAPGVFNLCFAHPNRGGAERRETFGCSGTRGARRNAACQALARRLASHDAGRSPLGAPPRRFWASGPRFRLLRRPPSYNGGQLPSGSVQRAPRSQVIVPGGGVPGLPERTVTSRRRRTPLLAPPSGSSPETPLDERGCEAM